MKKVSIIISLFFIACSKTMVDPKMDFKPPKYVEEMPSKEVQVRYSTPGSLFGKGNNPLFADRKAMRVNDILTVIIDEKTNLSSSAKKSLASQNLDNFGVANWQGNAGTVDKLNSITNLSFGVNSNNAFSGSGSIKRNDTFSTTITARIVKVLANGNYFIMGQKEILVNGEKQIIKISGVVRPYDIDETNTIHSKYISDAKIYYETQGDIDRSTTKPWGSKILEALWPF